LEGHPDGSGSRGEKFVLAAGFQGDSTTLTVAGVILAFLDGEVEVVRIIRGPRARG